MFAGATTAGVTTGGVAAGGVAGLGGTTAADVATTPPAMFGRGHPTLDRRVQHGVGHGVRPLRFHDLRRSFGSLLVAKGIDLASVQSAMGHSSITTTQRYLHARPAVEKADRFSQAFTIATPGDAVPAGTNAVAP